MSLYFNYLKKFGFLKFLIIILSLGFFIFEIIYNLHVTEFQQFSLLADSFLQGKFYFTQVYSSWWHDAVTFNGYNYWPQGPLPAVILMPFVLVFKGLNLFFYQGYLQIFLNIGVYFLVYKISKKFGYNSTDSLFFAFAFSFASAFMGVSFWPTGWFFAQVVATFFVFFALNEYFTKGRLWIIGILFGLVFLTRITAAFGLFFIIWNIVFNKNLRLGKKIRSFLTVIISITPFVLLFGIYNYSRFGNFFDQGYMLQSIAGNLSVAKDNGLFSLVHIPGNIYYFLVAGPIPIFGDTSSHVLTFPFLKADPWGLGLIFTSPYLIYLLFLSYKDKFSMRIILTILTIAIPVFSYYGIGWYQFGYRYSLDFLPLIFILFMRNYRLKYGNLSLGLKLAITFSAIFNYYLFSSIFGI